MSGLITLLAFACSEGGTEQQASEDSVAACRGRRTLETLTRHDSTGDVDTGTGDSDSGGETAPKPATAEATRRQWKRLRQRDVAPAPFRWTRTPTDGAQTSTCDDHHATIHPSAAETCNGIDDDCNALVDDGLTMYTSYVDGDGDGYGAGAAHTDCVVPTGFVTTSGDCDDGEARLASLRRGDVQRDRPTTATRRSSTVSRRTRRTRTGTGTATALGPRTRTAWCRPDP
jgi:hypothetical protein